MGNIALLFVQHLQFNGLILTRLQLHFLPGDSLLQTAPPE